METRDRYMIAAIMLTLLVMIVLVWIKTQIMPTCACSESKPWLNRTFYLQGTELHDTGADARPNIESAAEYFRYALKTNRLLFAIKPDGSIGYEKIPTNGVLEWHITRPIWTDPLDASGNLFDFNWSIVWRAGHTNGPFCVGKYDRSGELLSAHRIDYSTNILPALPPPDSNKMITVEVEH